MTHQQGTSLLTALLAVTGTTITVNTAQAAELLNRKPYTLRRWACKGTGPIRPIRINGRLSWRLSDIQDLLKGGA